MSVKSRNIGILGSGAWGTALSCILNKEKNNFSTKGKWISHVPHVHILNDIL